MNGSEDGRQPVPEEMILPVIEEQLSVDKRQVQTGRTRVTKRVTKVRSLVDEPVFRRTHELTRVPIERVVEAPEGPRYEGDTLIIPVYEERVVIEKRLVLVEEFQITRKVESSSEPREYELLKEEITVEREEGEQQ